MENEGIIGKSYELGKYYEKTYRGCSQCVIAALQDTLNIRNDDIFKAATGLTGGCGLTTDGACGAYVGAIMIISYIIGREKNNFADAEGIRYKTYELSRQLRDKYLKEYGTVICRDVQTRVMGRPYYLADQTELDKFHNAGAHDIYCPEVVGKAASWTTELIINEGLLQKLNL